MEIHLEDYIRDIPDFPKPGIVFKDITPMLRDGRAFRHACYLIAQHFWDMKIDVIVGPESRGFLFGTGVAMELGIGLVPLRKPGKLPHDTISHTYELEYGEDTLEMHRDAILAGQHVLVVDDLLATGGTAAACVELVRKSGGQVLGMSFVVELGFLDGRSGLDVPHVHSLVNFD